MSTRRKLILIGLVLAVATLIVYGRGIHHDFIQFDDNEYVVENHQVLRGMTWEGVVYYFTHRQQANWHPLTCCSHMLDVSLFDLRPGLHHLTNILFHTANVLLLFAVFVRMTRAVWRSALVAALFALHPLHVESVAWVAERKDVLSTFFWLLTMLAYVRYAERPGVGRYLLVALLLALGLMAKPMLVSLPLVLLLLDYWPLARLSGHDDTLAAQPSCGSGGAKSAEIPVARPIGPKTPFRTSPLRQQGVLGEPPGEESNQTKALFSRSAAAQASLRRLMLEKLPLLALALGSCVITFLMQRKGGAVKTFELFPLWVRAGNALVSYIKYLGKMFWPTDLAILYPHPGYSLTVRAIVLSGLLLVAITAVAIRARRRYPCLLVGWFWYVITLVPVVGLVQVGEQGMADRYTYVPLIGIFAMLAWGLPALAGPRFNKPLAAAACAAVAVLAVVACRQLGYWYNTVTLFDHAIAVTTNNYVAHNILGAYLARHGRQAEGIRHMQECLRIKPKDSEAHNNLGITLAEMGRPAEAEEEFRRVIAISPDHQRAHYNWATLLARTGRLTEAIEHYRHAIRTDPNYGAAYNNLVVTLFMAGDYAEAWREYHECFRIGFHPPKALHDLLSTKMPEPKDGEKKADK